MTISEFAEKHGVPYQTAVRSARKNQIPGVQVTQFGEFKVYMIPEGAKPPESPTGRPTKVAAAKRASAKPAAKKSKKGAAK
jgi:hypothetical protein